MAMSETTERVIRVWDIPVRLGHWLAVFTMIGVVITGYLGNEWLTWHQRGGFLLISWVLFRIIWGFIGSRHARFADFVRGPRAIMAYLRASRAGRAVFIAGHNPLGALSVLALLAAVLAQAVSGLFTTDDILFTGPLYCKVEDDFASLMMRFHKTWIWVLFGLVALHLAAIAGYRLLKGEDLVLPMLTGRKPAPASLPDDTGAYAGNLRALALAAVVLAAVFLGLPAIC